MLGLSLWCRGDGLTITHPTLGHNARSHRAQETPYFKRMATAGAYNERMPVTRATQLSRRLLATVSPSMAAQLEHFDWGTAQVVERGKDHTILIAPELAVARIPRRTDPDLTRKMTLLEQLQLPWGVPRPLSEVDRGVLQEYIPGTAHPHGTGDPQVLAEIVAVFAAYDPAGLSLTAPFAQRGRFSRNMLTALDAIVPDKMAWDIAEHVHGWTDDQVGAGLVHGDLAGHNMHWDNGELVGILDWDYAAVWDTALNATYLSLWHKVALGDITDVPNRARVWSGALGLYSLADALSWDVSPAGWRRLNKKVQPRILAAYQSLADAED